MLTVLMYGLKLEGHNESLAQGETRRPWILGLPISSTSVEAAAAWRRRRRRRLSRTDSRPPAAATAAMLSVATAARSNCEESE